MFSMITGAFVLALLKLVAGSTQTPNATYCSGNSEDVITMKDLTIYNAAIGEEMSFEYTLEVSREVDDDPLALFSMTAEGGGVPCYENIGSCIYSLCHGTTEVEKRMGAPWNNTCPIPAGSYYTYLNLTIPADAKQFLEGPDLQIKVEYVDSEDDLGCIKFNVVLEEA
ncbi:hypothetical protein MRX96_025514 [Rhipicephalus microplus]|uniref:uncharacterized protein LOC119165743 n=1 Tax=Rhipicephalus microplus TaxID=6941 RepID=UPI003F6B0215